jgi:hypothetical protein
MTHPSARRLVKGYQTSQNPMPLGAYALFVGVFNVLLGSFLATSKKTAPPSGRELVLLAVSTHKLSRFITKDAVTAPFRAPFTRYKEDLGYGEVNEEARGKGVRQAIGEALSCSYCMDAWVGLASLAALRRFPRPTRTALSLFTAIAGADFLHVAYESIRTEENVLTLEEERREKKSA